MGKWRSWHEKRAEILGTPPGAGAAYATARIRFELAEAVRQRREELGITQAELAASVGVRQPAIARFESGGTTPTIAMLEQFAGILQLRLRVELLPPGEES